MPEKKQDFPRQWVEFVNPDDKTELFKCDLTWLTSRWMCTWGQGCKGIDADNPDVGCCYFGAHFSDKKDMKATKRHAERLTPELWQNYREGTKRGFLEKDHEGEDKTRQYKGACIFHNRGGFKGGDGCAFHLLALKEGVKPHTLKPQVCWQLPIRRAFTEYERPDGFEMTIVEIGEYSRRGWGSGGKTLDWYCTNNTEAHVGTKPVYEYLVDELTELMGEAAYKILAQHCAARVRMIEAVKATGEKALAKGMALHIADPK